MQCKLAFHPVLLAMTEMGIRELLIGCRGGERWTLVVLAVLLVYFDCLQGWEPPLRAGIST